jgi:N-acetylglucosamine kinase-like BadF-type ATPase
VTIRAVLGVDGGASKTNALVVGESGRVLGFGQAGGSNHQVCGLDDAIEEIGGAARSAVEEAGLEPGSIEVGCFCLAGADLPEDRSMLQEALEGLNLARSVVLKNDALAALRAGLTSSWGVGVVCGAGFNAAGRAPTGEEIVLPALGWISGDWGGGGQLAQEMIRLVMRAWDGRGKETRLTGLVLRALDAPSVEALVPRLYHGQVAEVMILALVPLLFRAAAEGDEAARELVVRMGTEVAVTAVALIRRLDLAAEEVEVVLADGVFRGEGSLLINTVRSLVHEEAPRARILLPRYEPVVGAALMGFDSCGVELTGERRERLDETLPGSLKAPAGGSAAAS